MIEGFLLTLSIGLGLGVLTYPFIDRYYLKPRYAENVTYECFRAFEDRKPTEQELKSHSKTVERWL